MPEAVAQKVMPSPTANPLGAPLPATQVPASNNSVQSRAEVSHLRRLVREVRENTDNIQSKGGFGAQLWLVQGQQFFDDWRKPGTPSIDPASLVQRGQTLSTVLVFYGPGRDNKGLCNVHYNVVVRRPNGTVYDHRDDLIGYQDLAPTSDRQMMLGRDYVTLNIGIDDPVGIYTVEAVVRDNVGQVDLPLKQTFVVQ